MIILAIQIMRISFCFYHWQLMLWASFELTSSRMFLKVKVREKNGVLYSYVLAARDINYILILNDRCQNK